MMDSRIYGRLLFDEPREAPATSRDAALRTRHSLVKLKDIEPAVQHGSFRGQVDAGAKDCNDRKD